MEKEQRTEQLRQIRDEVVALTSSPLYQDRIRNHAYPVIGEGSHTAVVMLVGEAPGRNEAATGRPFCGAAGKVLDRLLASIDINRQDVYITNIVKDRPPNNRDPFPEEIRAYGPFLDRQINIIQPRVVVTLGRFAMGYIMKNFGREDQLTQISQMHGQAYAARAPYGEITIIPLYHPAVAVYDARQEATLQKDFQILRQYLPKI